MPSLLAKLTDAYQPNGVNAVPYVDNGAASPSVGTSIADRIRAKLPDVGQPLIGDGGQEGATIGATPFLKPALKYNDRIFKASKTMEQGGEHADAIPTHLADDFYKKAMTGEDLKDYNFGFMNHKGQFLDRQKALDYAINEGLVDASAGKYGVLTSTMMSDSSKPGVAIEGSK